MDEKFPEMVDLVYWDMGTESSIEISIIEQFTITVSIDRKGERIIMTVDLGELKDVLIREKFIETVNDSLKWWMIHQDDEWFTEMV